MAKAIVLEGSRRTQNGRKPGSNDDETELFIAVLENQWMFGTHLIPVTRTEEEEKKKKRRGGGGGVVVVRQIDKDSGADNPLILC